MGTLESEYMNTNAVCQDTVEIMMEKENAIIAKVANMTLYKTQMNKMTASE